MIQEEIEKLIRKALKELKFEVKEIPLEHPEHAEHGDYATSVSFALAKQAKKNPNEIAESIKSKIKKSKTIEKVEVVGGFVNFFISKEYLVKELSRVAKEKEKYGRGNAQKGKKIMIEYAHPNTHKEMHIGHMRTLITGEALCRILGAAGAKVFRANYQGDIGPHVAKALWGTEKILEERKMSWDEAEKLSLGEKAHLLGEGYVRGNQDYEGQKKEIDDLNAALYQADKDIKEMYLRTRKWSLEYYEAFYKRFDTKFDKLYFESDAFEKGKDIVQKNIGKVFVKSEGALVFKGEKYGLHTRVFVTKDGNPTYEGKEIALAPMQFKDFAFDKNIHVVANEQSGYFQVVFKVLELLDEKFKDREYHLAMGMVNLIGAKISSRTGVIITVDGLLNEVKENLQSLITSEELSKEEIEDIAEKGTISAVKYSVLRTDTKSNVAFDLKKSVALDGDSGPYLQYTYARCKSILRKAKVQNPKSNYTNFSSEELAVLRLIPRFEEVVQDAAEKFAPNIICTYVFDLAQAYNNFYNTHRVLDAKTKEQKEFRLLLTASTAQVIQNALKLLGIKTLERM